MLSSFDRMEFRAECNSVRSLISKAESFFQYCTWIKCQSSHTLETRGYKPMNQMPILAHPGNPWIISQSLHTLKTHQYNSSSKSLKLTSLVQSSQTLSISLFLEDFFIVIRTSSCPASFHWSTDPSLSTDDLNNFRSISNLNFISKMLKKASHIQSHLSSNSLFLFFQSAYRIFHSTETTILKIHNDLILAMRSLAFFLTYLQPLILWIILYFSIIRLHNWFGLDDLSLDWFSFYLLSRSQIVSIKSLISSLHFLLFPGVYLKVPSLAHCFYSRYYSSWFDDLKRFPNTHRVICTLMTPSYFTSTNSFQSLETPPLSLTFSPGLTWTLSYRFFHSNETTFLKIHNDLILAMDRGEVTCILLDLFAAFDTVVVSPQSIKNWISCYWHKTTTSQICWSYKQILSNDIIPVSFSAHFLLSLLCCLDIAYSVLMGR